MTSEVMGPTPARPTLSPMTDAVGALLREWRESRALSQQALSDVSTVSTRHLSRVETGLARPTPQMILHLSEHLAIPLRERNRLLLAGGYAPRYPDGAPDAADNAQIWPACAHCSTPISLIRPCSWTTTGMSSTRTPPSMCSSKAARPSCWNRRST